MASRSVVFFLRWLALTLLSGAVFSCGGGAQTVPLPAPESRVSVPPHDEEMVTLAAPARPAPRQSQELDRTSPSPTAEVATADAPEPVESETSSFPPPTRVRVDAMVGQINGRPLFASEFFAPMDARLRSEAARMNPEEWMVFASEQIRLALIDRVRNELLLAEVESSLTPEQREGLLTFVRNLREQRVSEARGSEALASRRLEAEGITLDEAVQAERDDELIRSWIRRILQNKVYVPWRDIRFRYERDFERFNPPSRAVLRMIRVSATDAESLEAVQSGLAAGVDMETLAREHSTYIPDEGGMFDAVLDAGDYSQSTLVGLAPLNEAAQRLSPGEVAGPLEVGSNVYWIKLEEIVDLKRSLYEVQERIRLELFSERARQAQDEYLNELIDRSGISTNEVERIGRRLIEIAAERYLMSRQN